MRRTHFSLFVVVLLLLLCLVWMYGDETKNQYIVPDIPISCYEVKFKTAGLPVDGILGTTQSPGYFSMRDDNTGTIVYLLHADVPFSVSEGGEEVRIDFDVIGSNIFTFEFAISTHGKQQYEHVLDLTGRSNCTHCQDYGIPISFYIKITKEGEDKPVIDKVESKTCFNGTGFGEGDIRYIYKEIAYKKLLPGKYFLYIKNMFPVKEYIPYRLFISTKSIY